MVMSFMEGTPLMQLRQKVAHLPKWKRDKVRLERGRQERAVGRGGAPTVTHITSHDSCTSLTPSLGTCSH